MLLENSKFGIQLAARIVDTPCNEMNTDAFLDEVKRDLTNIINMAMVNSTCYNPPCTLVPMAAIKGNKI